MNNVMLGMISFAEMAVILLMLLVMAGLAVGAVLLVVWLVRRQQDRAAVPPTPLSDHPHTTGRNGRFPFAEVHSGQVRIRWGSYIAGLAAVVIGGGLLNGLLLVAGVWSGVDTVLFGLLVAVVAFHLFVIRDFHRAGRARPVIPSPPTIPPTQPSPPVASPPTACPRCGATLPADSPQGLCPRCVMGVGMDTQTEATGECGPHGTKIVPPPEEEVARRFPHLEILGCLGHGGMGVVYKARQPKLNRLVALKILAPEKGADPKFAERFLREAQALARLSHPNIVTVHDFGEADGMFFLLMEFVDGMTLRQLLREARMKPEEALAIVPKICEALQFAHEQGVVHRDIKPENVLLDKQGRVKIADFGIAKLVGTEKPPAALTEERSVIGTPHYMAPEQVEKPQLVDHRADIYSLGVVFYEMLTGELPLGKFQPPSKKVQVDVRLDEVVLHALEKEPERRYQQASQVKTDVETIAGTPGSQVQPAATRVHVLRWRDLWLWDSSNVVAMAMVPMVISFGLTGLLWPFWGKRALLFLLLWGLGLAFAITYAFVGVRVRRLKSALPRPAGDVAEALMFKRPFQSPGLALLHSDRLELRWITGTVLTVPLEDITAVAEVRWFNGTRLWFKKGFVMDLANGQRIGVAVAEVFARRWRARLSRGSLPEIPAASGLVESREATATRFNGLEATIVFAGTFFFAFMLAVVRELSRASVVPFKEFWILLAIVGLLVCGLSLAGIWPFPSPWFPEPNFSSRNLRRHKTAVGSEVEQSPRFSRTAILGACWALLAIILGPTTSGSLSVALQRLLATNFTPPFGQSLLEILLRLVSNAFVLLVVIAAPFGATILGWIAAAQIRRSAGKLHGMWLAVFDGLLFPLLVLNALIAGAALMGLRLYAASQIASGPMVVTPVWVSFWWLGLVVLGVIVLVDWLIIRAVWRAANKPVGGGSAPAVALAAATPSRSGSGGKVVAVIVAVVLLVLAVPVGSMLLAIYLPYLARQQALSAEALVSVEQKLAQELKARLQEANFDAASVSVNINPRRRDRGECVISGLVKYEGPRPQEPGIQRLYSAANGGGTFRHEGGGLWLFTGDGALQRLRFHVDASAEMRVQSPAMTALLASFGPEREFLLTEFNNMDGREGLDLDTGIVLAQPKDLDHWSETELAQWIKDRGVDLFVDRGPGGQWGLLTTTAAELKLADVTNTDRARMTERELEEALSSGRLPAHEPTRGILKVYPWPKESPTATTLAFKTSSGSSGLLWITGFTDRPRGVKIGCKLVQEATKTPTASWSPFPKAAHLGRNDKSVMLHHDDVDLHYALFYAGDFNSSSRSSHNPRTKNWKDDGGLTLKSGRTFGYLRESDSPDRLRINGREYDLRQGRVFTLHDDGTANQFALFPPLAVARDLGELARLVAGAPAGLTFGPVIERELPDPDNGSGRGNRETLRLRTGEQMSVLDDAPKESGGRLRALAASQGDLFAEYDDFVSGRWALVTAGLKFSDLLPRQWETATLAELDEALRQPSALQRTEHSGATLYLLPEGLLPLTFALESRNGERGLLQITGFTDNPRGVKIHYKLAQPAH